MSEISVIMPVHSAIDPEHFNQAVISILNQTLTPSECIIIVDGPVKQYLKKQLMKIEQNSIVNVIYLKKNSGPGVTRSIGIDNAKSDIIALMDADDISLPERLEKQYKIINRGNIDVVGSWIEEFRVLPGDLKKVRVVPEDHSKIYRFGKWRMPVNNVSLMFTKESYKKAGGYTDQKRNEDWSLIVRMLVNDCKFYNIQEVLIKARAGENMIIRRRGWDHFFLGLKIFFMMYKLGYINYFHFITNLVIRVIVRLLPIKVTNILYEKFLRSKK